MDKNTKSICSFTRGVDPKRMRKPKQDLKRDDIIDLITCFECQRIVVQPVVCSECLVMFCNPCVENYQKSQTNIITRHKLPCEHNANLKLLATIGGPFLLVRKILDTVSFQCRNKCSESIPYKDLIEGVHEFVKCDKLLRECLKCKQQISNSKLLQHKRQCPNSQFQCQICNVKCTPQQMRTHFEFCNERNINKTSIVQYLSPMYSPVRSQIDLTDVPDIEQDFQQAITVQNVFDNNYTFNQDNAQQDTVRQIISYNQDESIVECEYCNKQYDENTNIEHPCNKIAKRIKKKQEEEQKQCNAIYCSICKPFQRSLTNTSFTCICNSCVSTLKRENRLGDIREQCHKCRSILKLKIFCKNCESNHNSSTTSTYIEVRETPRQSTHNQQSSSNNNTYIGRSDNKRFKREEHIQGRHHDPNKRHKNHHEDSNWDYPKDSRQKYYNSFHK